MHHGDTFWFDSVEDVFRCGRALIRIQASSAHHHFITTGGQVSVSRRRGDHQHAFIFIDVGSGLSGRRTQVTDHVTNTVVDHFVGNRNGLFRITGIVIFHANQFVALHAAFGIDISDRLFCPRKLHVTVLGDRT
ncbi:hypothetical protein SRABI106_03775 [Rahnella aquatilis]|nr:hypothetical protein SRABI106_03775 [Rahnella aquatilis]